METAGPRESWFAPAPAGRTVRLATRLVVIVVGVVVVVLALALPRRPGDTVAALALSALVVLALVVHWFCARIRGYRVVNGSLVVVRSLSSVTIPLHGLVSARADAAAMSGAWRLWGNGGFGAISGRFSSAKLGRFRAYVTDARRAVVLCWSDRCVVVSPADLARFIVALRPFLRAAED